MAPGDTAATTLTVRNDSDIVEAYSLEVVGDCASWTTVTPARVSLYPGTSETVTIRLEPPRSPEVRAGEMPLGVRVLPAEHPESVKVLETTVHVERFRELRAELAPRRRRGWLRGRYRLAVRNQGNAPAEVGFTAGQPGEELGFAFSPAERTLEPGESAEIGLRVRTGKPVWFGAPVVWPFTVDTTESGDQEEPRREEHAVRVPLDAEFVQIPVFPRWLLVLLAALLALLLAWFTLVRPAVRSAAKEAAHEAVQPRPTPAGEQGAAEQRSSAPALVPVLVPVRVPAPAARGRAPPPDRAVTARPATAPRPAVAGRPRRPSTCRRPAERPRPVPTRCPRTVSSASRTSSSPISRATKDC